MTARDEGVEHSWSVMDGVVERLIGLINPGVILDVGAGSGKYGRMARRCAPLCHQTALEYDAQAAQAFDLTAVYDEVVCQDALSFLKANPLKLYDLVILGDVIEHFLKSEGLDILNFLNYRAGYLLIVTPDAMPMAREPYQEGHNSVWTVRDFHWHDNFAWEKFGPVQLFLLRGFERWNAVPALADIVAEVNKADIALDIRDTGFAHHGLPFSRPCRLRHHLDDDSLPLGEQALTWRAR